MNTKFVVSVALGSISYKKKQNKKPPKKYKSKLGVT